PLLRSLALVTSVDKLVSSLPDALPSVSGFLGRQRRNTACITKARLQERQLIGTGLEAGEEAVEDFGHETRPEIAVAVVPGVEIDGDDFAAPGAFGYACAVGRLLRLVAGQRFHMPVHQVHEMTFPAAPVSEEAHGERKFCFAEHDQLGEAVGQVFDTEVVGDPSIAAHAAELGVVTRSAVDESPLGEGSLWLEVRLPFRVEGGIKHVDRKSTR